MARGAQTRPTRTEPRSPASGSWVPPVGVVDAEGLGALTLRRLATEPGVGTMSLYTYVPNKEDLLDGVLGTVLEETRIPLPDHDDPASAVQAYRVLVSFAIGLVSLEVGGFFRQSAEATFGSLPVDPLLAEQFPRIMEAGPHLVEWDADAEFEAAADLLFSLLSRPGGGEPPE